MTEKVLFINNHQSLAVMKHWDVAVTAAIAGLALAFLCMGNLAFAYSGYGGAGSSYGTPLSDVICQVVDWFQGNLGSGLATIAICSLGVGASFGKISWGLVLTVGVGVVVMFGATDLLKQAGVIDSGGWTCP